MPWRVLRTLRMILMPPALLVAAKTYKLCLSQSDSMLLITDPACYNA